MYVFDTFTGIMFTSGVELLELFPFTICLLSTVLLRRLKLLDTDILLGPNISVTVANLSMSFDSSGLVKDTVSPI